MLNTDPGSGLCGRPGFRVGLGGSLDISPSPGERQQFDRLLRLNPATKR